MSEEVYVDEEGRRFLLLATCSSDQSIKLAPLCLDSFDLLKPIFNLPEIHNSNI